MLRSVLFVVATGLALVYAEPIERAKRLGEFNRYFLYTGTVSASPIVFGTVNANYIDNAKTVVIVHGHGGSYQSSPNPEIRGEILAEENINVIAVDWSIFASGSYATAQSAVLSIGENLAELLDDQDLSPEDIHLIGFNLGAHIAGIAGRRYSGIARITGLDPSESNIKLSSTDANYVEVIHTDGSSSVLANGLGTKIGHADFFPNGGNFQPGCANNLCHHNRSWQLFTASIRSNTFRAFCCNTILEKNINLCRGVQLEMGNNELSKTPCATGIYRVNTLAIYPY